MTETYPPEIGGAAMVQERFVHALLDHGHTVHLLRPRQRGEGQAVSSPGLEQTLLRGVALPRHGLQLGLPAQGAILRAWRRERPDHVHVASEWMLGTSAQKAALRLGRPLTTAFHTNFHDYACHYGAGFLRGPLVAYLRRFHSRAGTTLVPTEQMRRRLAAEGFRNLAVVSRGVDTRRFDPARRRPELRRGWGASEDTLVAIVVGRLTPEKNLGLGVEAFRALERERPGAKLVLVGEGPERARLARQNPDFVFTGMLRGDELAAHYASADLLLFPSLSETFGNVTLEGMASGLAVIAFADAAALEHVRSGENGLLAPRADRVAFVRQAIALGRDPARARRLGRAARETACGLSWDAVGDAFESVIRAAYERARSEPSGRRGQVPAANRLPLRQAAPWIRR